MSLNMKQHLTALLCCVGNFCIARQWDHMAARVFKWAVSLMPGSTDLHFVLSQQAVAAKDFDGVTVEDGNDQSGTVTGQCTTIWTRSKARARWPPDRPSHFYYDIISSFC